MFRPLPKSDGGRVYCRCRARAGRGPIDPAISETQHGVKRPPDLLQRGSLAARLNSRHIKLDRPNPTGIADGRQ
jgi:hypothetical protein